MANSNYYANLPEDLLRDERISMGARLTYGILKSYGDSPFLKHKTIAKQLGLSPKSIGTVKRYLAELKEYGWITWRKRGFQKSNLYILNKVPTKLIGETNQLSANPSISSVRTLQLASHGATSNYQFSNYHLVENYDDDFIFGQEDDLMNDICRILDDEVIMSYDIQRIGNNIQELLSHYGHLNIITHIYKLRDAIIEGINNGQRIDPVRHLLKMFDQEDRRLYAAVINTSPQPLKGESQEEYQAKINALRVRNCPSDLSCPICWQNTSNLYAEKFHEVYFGKWSNTVLKQLHDKTPIASRFSMDERVWFIQILKENFQNITNSLCVDCTLRAYIHS